MTPKRKRIFVHETPTPDQIQVDINKAVAQIFEQPVVLPDHAVVGGIELVKRKLANGRTMMVRKSRAFVNDGRRKGKT